MLKGNSLEEQLRQWREAKAEKRPETAVAHAAPAVTPKERRTVRVNGQEVVIVKKPPRRSVAKHPES